MVKPKQLLNKIRKRTKHIRSKTSPAYSDPLIHQSTKQNQPVDFVPWFSLEDRKGFPSEYRFSDFILHHHKLLGEGTFSRVILATHTLTREQCAVKMIEKRLITPTMKPFVTNEPKFLARLGSHKQLVRLLHFHEDASFVYLFLNYVEGQDLHDRLDYLGILDERTARVWFSQLIELVEYCHSKGICHRDLKLENIILNSTNGEPKLTLVDFGFGGDLHKGLCYEFPGSLTYAPPELVQSIPYDGARADIYSLGVILYAFLQPGYPFYADERKELVELIIRSEPEFVVEISSSAEELIRWMLAKNPSDRPSIQQIKNHPFYTGEGERHSLSKKSKRVHNVKKRMKTSVSSRAPPRV